MMRTRKGAAIIALGATVSLGLAACGGGGGGSSTSSSGASGSAAKGGTLTLLNLGPTEHLDPQRMYVGADILDGSRLFTRTLTTFSPTGDNKLVPDLATDLGTMSDGGKTWKFTLAGGAKWEDGKDVTCDDVKYGISRTFAQDVITGGPNYAIQFLDIPTSKDAQGNDVSAYAGPYKKTGQDLYDKAVTCSGNTITFKFKKPWTDFNEAVTFPAFTAFRQDKDQGAKSDFAVFSDGPYKLDGTFDPDKGGTFVRNTYWDGSKDPIRKAYPDKMVWQNGVQTDTIYQRLIADSGDDKTAISLIQAAPALLPQIQSNPSAKARSVNPTSPYVDYVVPNFKSKVFSNATARQAFAMATNRNAYSTAYGGAQAMKPTYSIINPSLKAYHDFNPFGTPLQGDPAAAKKLLTDAGITTPVNITVVYRKRPTADKAFAALKTDWDKGGFNVTLEGIATKYYASIQDPSMATKDAFWAGWGADWPSGSTDIPPLFDGRVNISAGGSGQDYGYFNDPEVNAKIDQAYNIQDEAAREKAWGDIDEMIAKKGGYVALGAQKFTFMWGSGVKNFAVNSELGSYPDLAQIAVK